MKKDAVPLSAQVVGDHSSGVVYYTVSQGRTTSCTTLPSIPEFPESQMESPTYSQSSSDTGDTHWSTDAYMGRRVDEDYLPLIVKDSKLQAYFYRMEMTLRVFNPATIHAEAANLTREIVARPTDVGSSIQTAAETLVRAGYRKVECSRSCALIAHEIFYQLRSISDSASDSFRDCLIGAVTEIFEGYYLKVNLWHLGGLNGLSSVDEEMINVAGFAGDLFALGLLPVDVVHGSIFANLAYANQVSTVHCRALHLFLLRAKIHMGPPIGREMLRQVRKQLVRCSRGPPMSYDTMAQLWIIECCTVIDRTLEQDDLARQGVGKPVDISNRLGVIPSKEGWFSALIS